MYPKLMTIKQIKKEIDININTQRIIIKIMYKY